MELYDAFAPRLLVVSAIALKLWSHHAASRRGLLQQRGKMADAKKRARKVNPDEVLDAAERVVLKLGAAGLSIDAVAKEAGIGKSQVVYDHKTKTALLEALVERQLKREDARVKVAIEECGDAIHPELFGRIVAAGRTVEEMDRAVAMAVSASAPGDGGLQEIMRAWQQRNLDAMKAGPRPQAAFASYLALTGFCCMELFGFHNWSDAERERVLKVITSIYISFVEDRVKA